MEKINNTNMLGFEEFAKSLKRIEINKDTYETGGLVLGTDKENMYVDDTDSHSIIFGATGSKKTRMLIMPTIEVLKRAGESFIVTDPKGEIYQKTGGNLEELGYNKIIVNFRDFNRGDYYNPLLLAYDNYHNGDEAKAIEIAGNIADMILGDSSKLDPYWSSMAEDVIIGFIVLLLDITARHECNLKNLITLWYMYRVDHDKFLKKLLHDYRKHFVWMKLSCLDNKSDKTVGSIEAVVAGGINKLTMNEDFIQYLSHENKGIDSITAMKSAVYIIVPDENNYYHMAASILISQLYEVLIKSAQESENHRLARRTNFVIDEFTNLPTIANMEAMITASRSRNIRFMLVVQSMTQLTEKYREAQTIMSNCNNWIYLYSKEYSLLSQISELCGKVVYDNGIALPLLSEFDLQHLDKEKGEALVLSGRNNPCIVNLKDIDEYPYRNEAKPLPYRELYPVKQIPEEIFYEERNGNKKGIYRMSGDEIWYKLSLKKPFAAEELWNEMRRRWLVASYKGIVIDATECRKNSISDKMIFVAELIDKYGLDEVKKLDWLSGVYEMKNKAKELLDYRPELVYLNEIEIENHANDILVRENNLLQELNIVTLEELSRIQNDPMIKWRATLTMHILGEEDKEEDLGVIEAEDSRLGQECMINQCFRKANVLLMETIFKRSEWTMCTLGADKYFDFGKRAASTNWVRLLIRVGSN